MLGDMWNSRNARNARHEWEKEGGAAAGSGGQLMADRTTLFCVQALKPFCVFSSLVVFFL